MYKKINATLGLAVLFAATTLFPNYVTSDSIQTTILAALIIWACRYAAIKAGSICANAMANDTNADEASDNDNQFENMCVILCAVIAITIIATRIIISLIIAQWLLEGFIIKGLNTYLFMDIALYIFSLSEKSKKPDDKKLNNKKSANITQNNK